MFLNPHHRASPLCSYPLAFWTLSPLQWDSSSSSWDFTPPIIYFFFGGCSLQALDVFPRIFFSTRISFLTPYTGGYLLLQFLCTALSLSVFSASYFQFFPFCPPAVLLPLVIMDSSGFNFPLPNGIVMGSRPFCLHAFCITILKDFCFKSSDLVLFSQLSQHCAVDRAFS